MSKKRSAQKTGSPKPADSRKQKQTSGKQWLALAVLAVITFIVFYPTGKTEFTNWDDGTYVSQNPMIWKLDGKTVKNIFINSDKKETDPWFMNFTPVSLNYHPLTMLTLAVNYSFSGMNAAPYVITNNVIHILNMILVFLVIQALVNGYVRRNPSANFRPKAFPIALIVAGFFAIHPMRVESVTWIAERKDVLYVFFFFLSWLFYMRWIADRKISTAVFCFLFFVCSCLSKGMGVVLPVVLVLTDWFWGVAKTPKQLLMSILYKAHFFAASLVFGVVAYLIQSQGAIAAMETFTLFQRLTFGCYGFIMYIWKLFVPVNLSAFYPYPFTDTQGNIPGIYYASPFIVLIIAMTVLFFLWKKPEAGRILLFGFAFYFVTVALVLQFLSVGSVIMADRYSYLSHIGILFMIGCLFEYVRNKYGSQASNIFAAGLLIAGAYGAYLTHERTRIWENAKTLWTDAMNQYPFIEIAYENRGIYFKDHNQLDSMLLDYEFVTQKLHSRNEKIWSNLGNLYGMLGQQKDRAYFDKSLEAYSQAISIDPQNASTYLNRAITFSMMGKYQEAIPDFDKSIQLADNVALTYKNRAYTLLQLGQFEKSVSDYDKAIALYEYDTLSYLNRGISKFNAKMFGDAIADFKKYISMMPSQSQQAQAYFNASIAHKNMNQFSDALQSAVAAQKLGQAVSPEYLQDLQMKLKQ